MQIVLLYTSPQINTNKKGRENCSRIEIKKENTLIF